MDLGLSVAKKESVDLSVSRLGVAADMVRVFLFCNALDRFEAGEAFLKRSDDAEDIRIWIFGSISLGVLGVVGDFGVPGVLLCERILSAA